MEQLYLCVTKGTYKYTSLLSNRRNEFVVSFSSDGDLFCAYSDEAGHAFQSEAGHLFQHEAGQDSDLMSVTSCLLPQVVGDDVLSAGSGQVSVYFEGWDFDGDPRFRRLSPLRSSR